jgi:hypothetical protein
MLPRHVFLPIPIALALAFASAVSSARLPTAPEKAALRSAVIQYVREKTAVNPSGVKLSVYRVGTVDRRFARVNVAAPGNDPVLAVLRRTLGRWRVIDFGTENVGCALQLRVRVDLWIACQGRLP